MRLLNTALGASLVAVGLLVCPARAQAFDPLNMRRESKPPTAQAGKVPPRPKIRRQTPRPVRPRLTPVVKHKTARTIRSSALASSTHIQHWQPSNWNTTKTVLVVVAVVSAVGVVVAFLFLTMKPFKLDFNR